MLTVIENNKVTASLKRFWGQESIGITEAENPTMSQEEEYAVAEVNKGLKFDGQNYEVQLPWRKDHPRLENNYAQAVRRLESIERRLKRDPVKAESYRATISQYVEKGFEEEVSEQRNEDGIAVTYHTMQCSAQTKEQQSAELYLTVLHEKRVEFLSMIASFLVLHYSLTWHLFSSVFVPTESA